ncbi:uncharacterized protein L969DRAFT_54038 [Mixia osmundae IAM 14324]|uniref:Large ribosomal subunit protein bL32m n=1 Tax=Mixia osmundae (strain CBS 9802 / IAM 14324 / JCM 22182 / KY 12970) TaxID=764103 RepID=G7E276_MIXOS|nr:uncharacterized protein L969DRAFT_54038 [Mixia osmundae IAM 14324]KEI36808.1 hypothetical protein L969DRAFT_54038 [Mixia osmundae IAM 14324]GAA96936.1 hypothetical protein E5Q_03610 [Mixia osmundae IAM 14324]
MASLVSMRSLTAAHRLAHMVALPSLMLQSLQRDLSGIWARMEELFPSLVWAVPKSRVSHSRKSMRSANKGLKARSNIVHCPSCSQPKLAHHFCPHCYSQLSRAFKARNHQQTALA